MSLLVRQLHTGFAMMLHNEHHALIVTHELSIVRIGRVQRTVASSQIQPGPLSVAADYKLIQTQTLPPSV
ncbi:MAG: hypothetical protein IIA72_18635 [Proteobacteria bacterium]|nr:hypothetical protein [Pseudomonadota bacterium]